MALALATAFGVMAADDIKNDEFNPITTGVTSLGIAPDARGASMGDLGVASDPDVNSQFWNPSKYAFAYSSAAVSLSYTPWLRKLVNDIFLANLSAYYNALPAQRTGPVLRGAGAHRVGHAGGAGAPCAGRRLGQRDAHF